MTAGSGVIHSEMPVEEIRRNGGRMHAFQVWVNLPAKDKMIPPRYQEYSSEQIPKVRQDDGVVVRVIAGQVGKVRGAVETRTPVTYLHITLPPGTHFDAAVPASQNAMVYGISGAGESELVVFAHDGDVVGLANRDETRAA